MKFRIKKIEKTNKIGDNISSKTTFIIQYTKFNLGIIWFDLKIVFPTYYLANMYNSSGIKKYKITYNNDCNNLEYEWIPVYTGRYSYPAIFSSIEMSELNPEIIYIDSEFKKIIGFHTENSAKKFLSKYINEILKIQNNNKEVINNFKNKSYNIKTTYSTEINIDNLTFNDI